MKGFWILLFTVQLAVAQSRGAHVIPSISTIAVDRDSVTVLHLSAGYTTSIRLPEEVASVVLGNPTTFKAEHSDSEPNLLFFKPITTQSADSNALITTKSGEQISLYLISDARSQKSAKVDFVLEYKHDSSVLIQPSVSSSFERVPVEGADTGQKDRHDNLTDTVSKMLRREEAVASPDWQGNGLQFAIGQPYQLSPATMVAFSLLNRSDKTVELLMPDLQLTGTLKGKHSKDFKAEPIPIAQYEILKWKLGPGERTDGVVVFERPQFKEASEQLMLRIIQADKVDRPLSIPIPFVAQISGGAQ